MKRIALALCLMVTVAACGGTTGEGADGDPPATPTNDDADTASTGAQASTTTSSAGEDNSAAGPTESSGTVTIGDATYNVVIGDDGRCDSNYLGGFQAFMRQIDSAGALQVGGVTISVNEQGDGLIAGDLDGVQWEAGTAADSGTIDSVDINGDRARGTATFANSDTGEFVEGTFEVTCVDG